MDINGKRVDKKVFFVKLQATFKWLKKAFQEEREVFILAAMKLSNNNDSFSIIGDATDAFVINAIVSLIERLSRNYDVDGKSILLEIQKELSKRRIDDKADSQTQST